MQNGLHKSTTPGFLLAILCGFGASFVNFALAFGTPLVHAAQSLGASELHAANAVWLPLMIAGSVPNILYCFCFMWTNGTGNRFGQGGASHWGLAFIMAIFWLASTLLYGVSTMKLCSWGPIQNGHCLCRSL